MNFNKFKYVIKRKCNRLVQIIKSGKNYTEEQKEIFENAKVGDVIFCEMPMSDSNLYDVKPGHEQRPYIIVEKRDNYLMGYPSSHVRPKCLTNYKYFGIYKSINEDCYIRGRKLDSWTNSYYNLSKVKHIEIRNIGWFFQRPNDSDLDRLEKVLTIRKNNDLRAMRMNRKFNLDKGDIVADGDNVFYIYSSFKDDVYAHSLYPDKSRNTDYRKKVYAYNKSYYVDISDFTQLNPDLYANIINQATNESIKSIEEFKKDIKSKNSNKNKLEKEMHCKLIPGTLMRHKEYTDYVNIYLFSRTKKSYGVYYEELQEKKIIIHVLKRFREYKRFDILDRETFDKLIEKAKYDDDMKNFIIEQRNMWEERLNLED